MNTKRLFLLSLLSLQFIIASAQWTQQHSGMYGILFDVCFQDSLNGWIGAGEGLLLTHDGGKNWEQVEVPTPYPLRAIDFTDLKNGWAVASEGDIIHTEDGGQTWEFQDTQGTWRDFFAVEFIDSLNGWAAGGGSIMHTNNGGELWSQQFESSSDRFGSLSMVGDHGWVTGTRDNDIGIIFKTTDSGLHWSEIYANPQIDGVGEIEFLDTNRGWFVGEFGLIMHTSDGGNTWTDQSYNTDIPLEDIVFLDSLHGWAVGGGEWGWGSIILWTKDGGVSWVEQYQNPDKNLFRITFSDSNQGWAVGYPGFIIHTENASMNGVDEMDNEGPDLTVHAYPNPFTGSVHIINLPDHGQFRCSIIDTRNHQVKELTVYNNSEISLNDIDTGIYFMILDIGGNRLAEKIIKIR